MMKLDKDYTARVLKRLLSNAREIGAMDASVIPNPLATDSGYAHALGKCNGIARGMAMELEFLIRDVEGSK